MPFLTIITRCYKRPELLRNNIRSVKSQTDKDYEQLFIVDKIGHGLASADQALNKYKEYCLGDYVMVLDDDDILANSAFISTLKNYMTDSGKKPDVFIWRGQFIDPYRVLPPLDTTWGRTVTKTKIGSFNYAVSKELFNLHIPQCYSGVTGDFDFINSVLNNIPISNVAWVEDIMVCCQYKSKGTAIEGNPVEVRGNKRIIHRKN